MMQHGSESWMTTLTIRNVDAALKEELRVRAARHGRSLRHILREALSGEKRRAEPNLAEAIRRRFPAAGRSRRAGTAPARAGARSAAVRSVIVLDTNVLSELIRSEPAAAVFAWVSAQPRATLYTTSVSKAEILYGIAALPKGRRRLALAAAAEAMFPDDFEGRVLPLRRDCRRPLRGYCRRPPTRRPPHRGLRRPDRRHRPRRWRRARHPRSRRVRGGFWPAPHQPVGRAMTGDLLGPPLCFQRSCSP
jgi:plasmid stability protein/predicted nucleic acid-binding protein